jgi:hypothetical protein
MITDKASRLLKKVQALFDNLADQGSASALERDLLLKYLRDLYEELSSTESQTGSQKPENTAESAIRHSRAEIRPAAPVEETPLRYVPEPKVIPVQSDPKPTGHQSAVLQPAAQEPSGISPVDAGSGSTHAVASSTATPALSALFEFKELSELSEKLKLQPVERIEHGMGINERMLAINELFNGDIELFKTTLDHLNSLRSFADAQAFLLNGVATQNQWADAMRKAKAVMFIQQVRRRYVGMQ